VRSPATRDIITTVGRRRLLAIQLAGLGALCGSLCACGVTSEPPPPNLNDKVISAVKANDVEAVRTLLQQGAPVDARESGEGSDAGYTALLYAVEHRFLPLAQLLLRSGADPTLPAGPQNVFPLLKAARAGERDMLVLLLDYRANINQKRPGDGIDALAVACLEGQLTSVDLLVARNAAVEPQDLSYAIGAGHVDIVKRLLDAGADAAWTFNGRTMTQVARESPGRTRGDLEALLHRDAVRRNQSHTQNAAPAGR
jgi:ankyrin repeat protein